MTLTDCDYAVWEPSPHTPECLQLMARAGRIGVVGPHEDGVRWWWFITGSLSDYPMEASMESAQARVEGVYRVCFAEDCDMMATPDDAFTLFTESRLTNADGAGVAWRDCDDSSPDGVVFDNA